LLSGAGAFGTGFGTALGAGFGAGLEAGAFFTVAACVFALLAGALRGGLLPGADTVAAVSTVFVAAVCADSAVLTSGCGTGWAATAFSAPGATVPLLVVSGTSLTLIAISTFTM